MRVETRCSYVKSQGTHDICLLLESMPALVTQPIWCCRCRGDPAAGQFVLHWGWAELAETQEIPLDCDPLLSLGMLQVGAASDKPLNDLQHHHGGNLRESSVWHAGLASSGPPFGHSH